MNPKLYVLSDPDLLHEEHNAVIPVGDGSEVLDVKLIPFKMQFGTIQELPHYPVNGKNWEDLANLAMELAEDYRQMAKNQMDTNKTLLDMLKLSNQDMKDDTQN